jgi:hypothetical protein
VPTPCDITDVSPDRILPYRVSTRKWNRHGQEVDVIMGAVWSREEMVLDLIGYLRWRLFHLYRRSRPGYRIQRRLAPIGLPGWGGTLVVRALTSSHWNVSLICIRARYNIFTNITESWLLRFISWSCVRFRLLRIVFTPIIFSEKGAHRQMHLTLVDRYMLDPVLLGR